MQNLGLGGIENIPDNFENFQWILIFIIFKRKQETYIIIIVTVL